MSVTFYIEIFGKLWQLSLVVGKLGHTCKQSIAHLTTELCVKASCLSCLQGITGLSSHWHGLMVKAGKTEVEETSATASPIASAAIW